jgi:hypothetical protein
VAPRALPHGLDAAHAGERQVHEHQIRAEQRYHLDCLLARARLAHHVVADGPPQLLPQAASNHRVVIDKEDANGRRPFVGRTLTGLASLHTDAFALGGTRRHGRRHWQGEEERGSSLFQVGD